MSTPTTFKKISDLTAASTPLSGTELLEIESAGGTSGKVTSQDVANLASGFANPMSASQDLIIGGASGAPTRFPIIPDGKVLGAVDGAWAAVDPGSGNELDSSGDALDSNGDPINVAKTDEANVFTAQQAVTPYRANISGTVSIDLAATAKSNNLHLTLTGNVTSFALTNPVDGAVYNIRFIQDSTGSRTITLPSAFKFAGGTAPTFSTAANAVDFMSAEYGSTEATYMAAFQKGMA